MTVYRVANMTYQWDGDKALLTDLAHGADVLMLVECRTRANEPLDIADLLGEEWHVRQNLASADRAGSAMAVRKTSGLVVRSSGLRLLSAPGPNVQARYLRTLSLLDHGRATRLGVLHLALRSTGMQQNGEHVARQWWEQSRAMRERSALRWLLAGDGNQDPEDFVRKVGAPHGYGAEPMVAAWSNGWDIKTHSAAAAHADHRVLTLRSRDRG